MPRGGARAHATKAQGVPPGPAGIVLMNTLFWKILVTRVNGKMCAPGADLGLVHPPHANHGGGGKCFWQATIANIFRARRLSGSLAALVWRFRKTPPYFRRGPKRRS